MIANYENSGTTTAASSALLTDQELFAWFAEEVQPLENVLRCYLLGRFPSIDTDDVMQEAFIRILKMRRQKPVPNVKAYLITIARNEAFDVLRSRARSPFLEVSETTLEKISDGAPTAQRQCVARQELDDLLTIIEMLPPRCRLVFRLRRLQGLSMREICAELSICEATIDNHMTRAIRWCTEQFELRRAGASWETIRANSPHPQIRYADSLLASICREGSPEIAAT